MYTSTHTHYLPVSWWLSALLIGAILILILSYAVNSILQKMVSGAFGPLDFLELVVVMILLLPAGIFLLAAPFSTKVIVLSNGLEYHTPTFILQTDWPSLVIPGDASGMNSGDPLVVIPKDGTIQLRRWAKPFQKVLRHDVKHVVIPVSQFGKHHGHSLEAEIGDYMSDKTGQD